MSRTLSDERIATLLEAAEYDTPIRAGHKRGYAAALRELQQRRALAAVQAQPASARPDVAEVYPNSDRGLLAMTEKWIEMTKSQRLGTLRGIQSAAFRAGRADALLARVPAPAVGEWQPIETAPKDGTRVLVWWEYWSAYPVVSYFKHGRWNGEIACSEGDEQPTHWQPLPEPPAALQRARRAPQGEQP